MKIEKIISDADGVIINSQKKAWENAHKIVSLFQSIPKFNNLAEFKKYFSREAQIALVGEVESEILRAMHRLLMRNSSNQISCFEEILEIYSSIRLDKILVTSAYSEGIKEILYSKQPIFSKIYGYESGKKIEVLKQILSGVEIYITDTVKDINICKKINMPVIAVSWGYDTKKELLIAEPDYFVNSALELKQILNNLST